jgi:peptidoglycan lytic transglycosylase A
MKLTISILVLILILFAGCQSAPEPKPDYSRPLGDGQSALVRVNQGDLIPSLGDAWLNRDEGLFESIDQSITWFDAPSSRQFFPFEDIVTHEQGRASLVAFRELLESARSPNEFRREVWRRFEMYRSVGWNGQGIVLFTGYCAPEFRASRTRAPGFEYPLYRRPADLATDPVTGEPLGRRMPGGGFAPYATREEIERQGLLSGTELVWLTDPLSAYIVHVNGSAKLTLTDGSVLYVGYNGKTDRPYSGLGAAAVEEGLIPPEKLGLPALREAWRREPARVEELMLRNESYVFFTGYDGAGWPAGSLGVRVTAMSSLATDKKIYPRGGVVFVATAVTGADGRHRDFLRFMLDQDTGGAIRAPGRADIFMGIGSEAETLAGRQYSEGALYYIFLKPEFLAVP